MTAKLHEELSGQKAKELSSLKERLLCEKKTAVGRVEHRMNEQVAKLQQQLLKAKEQNKEEMVALETEMSKQLAEEKEKNDQLRESLRSTKKVKSPVLLHMTNYRSAQRLY